MFTTKVLVVPHLRMMMAGTGASGFLVRWFVRVNSGKVVAGIDNLDYHTPKSLADLWQEFKKEKNLVSDDETTTVYHFGFSETTGRIHSYAYRSANGFISEAVGYGIGVKPECTAHENIELSGDIIRMMDEQRALQEHQDYLERYPNGYTRHFHPAELVPSASRSLKPIPADLIADLGSGWEIC